MSQPPAAEAYLDAVLALWAERRERTYCPLSGNSMAPLIRHGDLLLIEHGNENLRIGDVIVFRSAGKFTAHRLIRRKRTRKGTVVLLAKGDRCRTLDAPIRAERVIGKVIEVRGSNGHLRLTSRFWVASAYALAALSLVSARRGLSPSPFGGIARLFSALRSKTPPWHLKFQAMFAHALCATDRLLFTQRSVHVGTRRRDH